MVTVIVQRPLVVAAPLENDSVFVREPPAETRAKSSGVGEMEAVRPVAEDVGGVTVTEYEAVVSPLNGAPPLFMNAPQPPLSVVVTVCAGIARPGKVFPKPVETGDS